MIEAGRIALQKEKEEKLKMTLMPELLIGLEDEKRKLEREARQREIAAKRRDIVKEPFSKMINREMRDKAGQHGKLQTEAFYTPKYDFVYKKDPVLLDYRHSATRSPISPREAANSMHSESK
jgi:hypothetical protein